MSGQAQIGDREQIAERKRAEVKRAKAEAKARGYHD